LDDLERLLPAPPSKYFFHRNLFFASLRLCVEIEKITTEVTEDSEFQKIRWKSQRAGAFGTGPSSSL
jgi:hypothetical protein